MTIKDEDFLELCQLLTDESLFVPDNEVNESKSKAKLKEKNVIDNNCEFFNTKIDRLIHLDKIYPRSWCTIEDIILHGVITEYFVINGKQPRWSLVHDSCSNAIIKYQNLVRHS